MKSRVALHRLATTTTRMISRRTNNNNGGIVLASLQQQQQQQQGFCGRKDDGNTIVCGCCSSNDSRRFITTRTTTTTTISSDIKNRINNNNCTSLSLSSAAVMIDDDDTTHWDDENITIQINNESSNTHIHATNPSVKHCETCSCDDHGEHDKQNASSTNTTSSVLKNKSNKNNVVDDDDDHSFPCGNPQHEDETEDLPPPLPEPRFSVHKRVLPSSLIALSSKEGRKLLLETLTQETAASYWSLTEQFENQSDPAFCGITTLQMVLNSMSVDPQVRWRGGWRFYGSEEVLLNRCCLSAERIRRIGVTVEEFRLLGRCHGLSVELKRPPSSTTTTTNDDDEFDDDDYIGDSINEFRNDIRRVLTEANKNDNSILVVAFSRSELGQTGDGHFSPLAAYHEESDHVLLLDVARFKYAPYWVSITDMYHAMQAKDSVTNKPRGWFVLHPEGTTTEKINDDDEHKRPAELVPRAEDKDICPIGTVKVDFCAANHRDNSNNDA